MNARDILRREKEFVDRIYGTCKTPGMKIRSRGMGRGLGIGRGRGPLGVPIGRKLRGGLFNDRY